METRVLISNIIHLLYRTKETNINGYEQVIKNSLDLLNVENNDEQFLGVSRTKKLLEYLNDVNANGESFSSETFIPTIELLLENDPKLFKTISRSLEREMDENKSKKVIGSLTGTINAYMREREALAIINKMSYETKFNRAKINNFAAYLQSQLRALEQYTVDFQAEEDPAIVGSIDFDDLESVVEQMEAAKQRNESAGRYICGFDGINNMTGGGFKPGETVGIGALQHKYKTGLTLSLFNQILTLNKPIMTEEEIAKGLKPLAIRLTLEDELADNMQWSFAYQKCNDGEIVKPKDLCNFTSVEMSSFLTTRLRQNGWHVIMKKINPSEWNVTKFLTWLLKLQSEGYKVCFTMLDYLGLMPTNDCIQGAAGQDRRDQLRRAKNFMSAHSILFMTPFQFNTRAKELLRNGLPDAQFLKHVAEKGYYDGCGTLDQELDLELYCHLVQHNGEKWLAIGRGKHRGSVLEREEEKFIYYKFPMPNVAVLEDHGKDRQWYTSLPRAGGGDFSGQDSLLNEVLGM